MKRHQVGPLLIVTMCAVILSISLYPLTASSAPKRGLHTVWEHARQAGSYHFTADIVQTTTPLPTVANVGRHSKQDRLYIEGQTDLSARQLEMVLWSGGGSVLDTLSGAQVRVEGDQAYVRQGDQPWQEVDDFTGAFAPENDFMTFLVAAKNVVDQGLETRAWITFSRYTFDIDGPGYAAYVRDQLEQELTASGELPPGMALDLPQQYVDMNGQGELWVDAGGLPLRQILHLELPDSSDQQTRAEITVDFSQFGSGNALAGSISPIRSLASGLQRLALMTVWLGLMAPLIIHPRSRRVYAAAALTVILSMLVSPVLQTVQAAAFFERQASRAQEREQQHQESEMQEALKTLEMASASSLQAPAALWMI